MTQTPEQLMDAAMDIAAAVTDGTIAPTEIEAATLAKCREAVGVVYGPHDPLWELHRDITRQYLHAGGLTVEELLEWVAVMRSRQPEPEQESGPSWIEQALAEGADDEDDDGPMPADEVLARASKAIAALDDE